MLVNKMTFSIRELSENTSYTATLVVNGTPTAFSTVIVNGSVSKSASSTGSVQLNQEDLITILVSWNGGALNRGASISLLANKL
jgi:hypothetical protein